MARYSDKGLQVMGDILQGHRQNNDPRYGMFLQIVAMQTGTTPDYVNSMVDYYANMKTE